MSLQHCIVILSPPKPKNRFLLKPKHAANITLHGIHTFCGRNGRSCDRYFPPQKNDARILAISKMAHHAPVEESLDRFNSCRPSCTGFFVESSSNLVLRVTSRSSAVLGFLAIAILEAVLRNAGRVVGVTKTWSTAH